MSKRLNISQIEQIIIKMEDEASRTCQNYIGVDVKSAEMRMGFEKGRGSALLEALSVIQHLRKELEYYQDIILKLQQILDCVGGEPELLCGMIGEIIDENVCLNWQHIAYAPLDGTIVNLYDAEDEFPSVKTASFREPTDGEWWALGISNPEPDDLKQGLMGHCKKQWITDYGAPVHNPTHWKEITLPEEDYDDLSM